MTVCVTAEGVLDGLGGGAFVGEVGSSLLGAFRREWEEAPQHSVPVQVALLKNCPTKGSRGMGQSLKCEVKKGFFF